MGTGAPPADGRPRARGHLRRVRGARHRYRLAGGWPPPGRSSSLRMGVQRFPAGEPDRDRGCRDAGRPRAAGAADARRPCPVRARPGSRRDRAEHGGPRGGEGGAGPWRRGRTRSGIRGDLPVLSRRRPAENVRRAFHRMGGARPSWPGDRRPGGRGSWLAVGIPGLAAAGDRGWGTGRAGPAARPATRKSGNSHSAVPGRARRGGRRRHGPGVAQFRCRARGRCRRHRRRRPSRCLTASAHAPSVSVRTAWADRHNPQPRAADVQLLCRRRICPVRDRERPPCPDGAGRSRAHGVHPHVDGRIVGAGPLYRPVRSAPPSPARRVPGRHRPWRDVRRTPAVGASRVGGRGLGAGRRGDWHRLCPAVRDHARSRRRGRGGPGNLGSATLRRARSGPRYRGGGGDRGRRRSRDRARSRGRASVLVRHRGCSHRGHRRSAASQPAHIPLAGRNGLKDDPLAAAGDCRQRAGPRFGPDGLIYKRCRSRRTTWARRRCWSRCPGSRR